VAAPIVPVDARAHFPVALAVIHRAGAQDYVLTVTVDDERLVPSALTAVAVTVVGPGPTGRSAAHVPSDPMATGAPLTVALDPAVATPRTSTAPEPLRTALLMLMLTLDELDTLPPCADSDAAAVDGVVAPPVVRDVPFADPPAHDVSTTVAAAMHMKVQTRPRCHIRACARRVTIEPLRVRPVPAESTFPACGIRCENVSGIPSSTPTVTWSNSFRSCVTSCESSVVNRSHGSSTGSRPRPL
jgi:hypothetical protein